MLVARDYQPFAGALITYLAQVFVEAQMPPETSTVVSGVCGENPRGVEQHQAQAVGREHALGHFVSRSPFPTTCAALFCSGARSLLLVVRHTLHGCGKGAGPLVFLNRRHANSLFAHLSRERINVTNQPQH